MNQLPDPETISNYEKLGIVGILILVLIILLGVGTWLILTFRRALSQAISYVQAQTTALTATHAKLDNVEESQTRIHERMDQLFGCAKTGCPVLAMRRAAQTQD